MKKVIKSNEKNYEAVFCANCGKKYLRRKKIRKGRKSIFKIRGFNTINCSRKCSFNWTAQRGQRNEN